MTDISGVAPGGGAEAIVSVPVSTPAEPDRSPISATEAARQLAAFRWKRDNPEAAKAEEQSAAPAPEAAAEPEQVSTDSAPETAPAEPTEAAEPAEELPPIEPPRSWTKDEKDRFASLPRETQDYIAQREQEREREIRRSQNEAAEQRKAIEAERTKVDQARQQYEAALPALLQTLHEQQQGEFSDIKTMADVEKLAREDWPRYALWDAQQKKIAAISAEVKAAQERQQSEYKAKWQEFASKEDAKAVERIPELADKAKAAKIADAAMETLEAVGFTREEFAKAWTGEASISPRDHRWQQVLHKAALYDQAKATAAKPPAKPVPPVQRPGVSQPKTAANDAQIQALKQAFEKNPTVKNAAALKTAERQFASR